MSSITNILDEAFFLIKKEKTRKWFSFQQEKSWLTLFETRIGNDNFSSWQLLQIFYEEYARLLTHEDKNKFRDGYFRLTGFFKWEQQNGLWHLFQALINHYIQEKQISMPQKYVDYLENWSSYSLGFRQKKAFELMSYFQLVEEEIIGKTNTNLESSISNLSPHLVMKSVNNYYYPEKQKYFIVRLFKKIFFTQKSKFPTDMPNNNSLVRHILKTNLSVPYTITSMERSLKLILEAQSLSNLRLHNDKVNTQKSHLVELIASIHPSEKDSLMRKINDFLSAYPGLKLLEDNLINFDQIIKNCFSYKLQKWSLEIINKLALDLNGDSRVTLEDIQNTLSNLPEENQNPEYQEIIENNMRFISDNFQLGLDQNITKGQLIAALKDRAERIFRVKNPEVNVILTSLNRSVFSIHTPTTTLISQPRSLFRSTPKTPLKMEQILFLDFENLCNVASQTNEAAWGDCWENFCSKSDAFALRLDAESYINDCDPLSNGLPHLSSCLSQTNSKVPTYTGVLSLWRSIQRREISCEKLFIIMRCIKKINDDNNSRPTENIIHQVEEYSWNMMQKIYGMPIPRENLTLDTKERAIVLGNDVNLNLALDVDTNNSSASDTASVPSFPLSSSVLDRSASKELQSSIISPNAPSLLTSTLPSRNESVPVPSLPPSIITPHVISEGKHRKTTTNNTISVPSLFSSFATPVSQISHVNRRLSFSEEDSKQLGNVNNFSISST